MSVSPRPAPPGAARSPGATVVLLVLSTAIVTYSLQQSLLTPAIPELQHRLGISQATASWLLTVYLLSASVATPIVGRLGDLLGNRRVLLSVLVVLGGGTALCAVASSAPPLLAGRAVQGVGGGVFPLAYRIVRDNAPPERIASDIGVISSLLGIGGGAGVVLAGVIVDSVSYHWLFWMPLALVAVSFAAVWICIPAAPRRAGDRVNWGSAALMSAGLVAVLVALTKTSSWGWLSPRTLALAGAGAALLGLWVSRDRRSSQPLVDMRMMARRAVWTTNLVTVLVGAAMWSAYMLIPALAQAPGRPSGGFAASVTASGLLLLPMTVVMLLLGPLAGRIERRVGSPAALVAGLAVCTVGLAMLMVLRTTLWQVCVASGLLGVGIGLAIAAITNLIVANVRADQTGVATGMNTIMRLVGGALGTQVAAALLAASGERGVPTAGGYTLAFAVSALVVGAAAGVALMAPRRRGAAEPVVR